MASEQHTPDEEISRRQHHADKFEASQREFYARVWREARTPSSPAREGGLPPGVDVD
ncbi:hypothetical protein [Cupriavidus necator]